MLKLKDDFNLQFYNTFIVGFLRYREIRDVVIDNKWVYFNDLMSKKKLSKLAEFQILFDTLTWLKFSNNLKLDTILYFELIISTYFNERMDESIGIPNSRIGSNFDIKNKIHFTPRKVLEILLSSAEWIPDTSVFEENEFDRICDALGCLLQSTDEFDWTRPYDTQLLLESIIEK